MPHSFVRLVDGVNENRTPALNEFSISSSEAIRYQHDNSGEILCQKLGGWTKFYGSTLGAPVRALWAWENTEAQMFLAVGTQSGAGTFAAQLGVIQANSLADITPREALDDISPVVSATAASSIITITDTTTQNITQFDSVYIPAHIAIGGIVLFGLYACDPDGHLAATTYTVRSVDVLGNALPATGSSSSPVLAQLTTTSGSTLVTVTLPNHGYSVGDVFPILIPTTVGGAEFFSHYPVQSVTDANNFIIVASFLPTSSTSGYINNGYAQFIYSIGVGALPTGTGFGRGGFGRGGFGTGVAPTAYLGSPVSADDWLLDNWGEVLVAAAVPTPLVLTTTGTSGTGVTGTITFSETYTIPVNATFTVSGVVPSGWNGIHVATASSSGSVSFASALTSSQTGAGTITVGNATFSPICTWDSESGEPFASAIAEAPPVNAGMFVAMPQRQIVAWGSTFTGISDPLLIRWCDVNNFHQWIGQITNQAGSYRLTKGSRIVGALQGPQQGLVWTDIDLWAMQYIGTPYVYSFNEIGTGCGLISRKAAASVNGVIYWMAPSQFFTLSGEGVQPLSCPVWDIMFQDLDQTNLEKIRIAVNSRFNEVQWFYPTMDSGGEVAAYVKYNYSIGLWDYGTIARSAWIDQSVLGPPIGADPNTRLLYQHETSADADGQALVSSFQTGYFALNEGDEKVFIDQVWPDMKWGTYGGAQNATINLTFYATDYPGMTPNAYGPFSMVQSTQFVTPRLRGRLISVGIQSQDVGSFWRIGKIRYRWQPDGRF